MNDPWTAYPRYGELYDGDTRICRFNPSDSPDRGLFLTSDGVEGWDVLPDAKTSLSERGQGDGAHDVGEGDIMYSARTVTVHYEAVGLDRADLLSMMRHVNAMAHRSGTLRFVDGDEDTYVTGYVAQMGRDSQWNPRIETGLSLHFVAPRPERLSWHEAVLQLFPTRTGREGLFFGKPKQDGSRPGLALSPAIQFGGESHLDSRNRGTLVNRGTSRAYPTFTLTGPFPSGVRLRFGDGHEVAFSAPVREAAPVLLDCRSRTASINGTDVSQYLTARGFPTVPANGSLAVVLDTAGDGYVTSRIRDTYM